MTKTIITTLDRWEVVIDAAGEEHWELVDMQDYPKKRNWHSETAEERSARMSRTSKARWNKNTTTTLKGDTPCQQIGFGS